MTSPVRPVPDFDDGDSDEDDAKLDEQKVDDKKEEEIEEVEVEEPEIPAEETSSGSQEILQALKRLTDAVTTLANRNPRSRSPLRRRKSAGTPEPSQRPARSRSPVRSTRPTVKTAPTMPKSPPPPPKPVSPHTPDHPPPPDRPPPRLLSKSRYDEELWVLLTNDGVPKVDQVDPELLHVLAGAAMNWSNRDRVLRLVNHDLPPKDQQWYGIRVDIKIRGGVYTSAVSKAGWMTKWGWIKTVYVRKREPGAVWERIQNGEPVGDLANVPEPWSEVISFTHRAPQGYMVLQPRVVLAPRSEIRSFLPPTPPKPGRLRESSRTPDTEDTRTADESTASQTVRLESESQSPTSPASTESASYEPVAHMAWDLDRREQVEINLDDSNETDSEVPPDPNAQPSSSGVLHIPLHVAPSERTTMSRKHRRAVLEGIDRLNHNDALVKSSVGLKDPRLFQELQAADGVADVFDVGVGAENLNPDEDSKIWYDASSLP